MSLKKKLSLLKFPLLLDTIGVSLAQLAKREKVTIKLRLYKQFKDYLRSNTHKMTLGNPRTFNRQDSSSAKVTETNFHFY